MAKNGNIFRVLDLYGREAVVSNLFAWLLNPKEDHGFGFSFLNDFLSITIQDEFDERNDIEVKREFHGKAGSKNNYIDLVIIEKTNGKAIKVIAIENKVFSKEGVNQAQRYAELIRQSFGSDNCKEYYIYLTRSNLPENISCTKFKQIKYNDIEEILRKYSTNRLVHDFYDRYLLCDRSKLAELEKQTLPQSSLSPDLAQDLCFFVTEKLTNSSSDISCSIGRSAKGGEAFYQAWKQRWFKRIDTELFNIHIEGYPIRNVIYVHFEKFPYEPYSKLTNSMQEAINSEKMNLIKLINPVKDEINIEGLEKKDIRGNAVLTVANFKIKVNSFIDYQNVVFGLINRLDKIILNVYTDPI